ncbi:TPA: sugar-phosphatase [Escherichia coli]
MGLFDEVVGAFLKGDAGKYQAILSWVEEQGGIQVLLEKLQSGGLGAILSTWLSNQQGNQSVSGEQLESALGTNAVSDLGQKLGVDTSTASSLLAEQLPKIIDALSPQGEVSPQANNDLLSAGMELPGDYCITYNGALVQKAADGSTVAQTALSYDDYRFLEKLSREVGSHFHALDRTTLYTANRDISYYTVHESFVATIPLVFCEAEKMDPNTQFLKVMMIDEPAILDQAIARIPQEVKEKYTVLKSAPYFLEILDKRVNKGTGVKSLADVLGIKPEEIMAIGDQENDIAMIEYAGVGVAMDNAIPSVKEVANFVTKSNLEDGVAFAIEKYVLN